MCLRNTLDAARWRSLSHFPDTASHSSANGISPATGRTRCFPPPGTMPRRRCIALSRKKANSNCRMNQLKRQLRRIVQIAIPIPAARFAPQQRPAAGPAGILRCSIGNSAACDPAQFRCVMHRWRENSLVSVLCTHGFGEMCPSFVRFDRRLSTSCNSTIWPDLGPLTYMHVHALMENRARCFIWKSLKAASDHFHRHALFACANACSYI